MSQSRASLLILAASAGVLAAADGPVQFNRDIRSILTENCFQCHGPDPGSRKAGLRLDTKEGFFASTDKRGPTIIAGKPTDSPLFQRITSTDPEEVMPQPESHKQLKPEEKETIKKWIGEGASWQPHWSFVKPERPRVPQIDQPKFKIRNPIDAFVLKKLAEKGLDPAPKSDRRALARRLSFDLCGLPPTPEEVAAFVNDTAPDYYEKYVDALIAKTQYGEHRARYWLDAARYADTHGLHHDNYREIWPYRDWVIGAFNKNEPFDQFSIEQLAGDLLPNPTTDQLIATGFHRCNITTNEGGTIVEENLANNARERVEATSWVWLGLTANCAVCHDHKFDPISTKEFYAMSAFFRNTTQPGLDGNVKDSAPSIRIPAMGPDKARWAALPGEITAAKTSRDARKSAAAPEFAAWLGALKPEELNKVGDAASVVAHLLLNEGSGMEVSGTCSPEPRKFKASAEVKWQTGGKLGSAPELPKGVHFDLGNLGDFEKDQSFSYGCWVKIPKGFNGYGAIMARMDDKNAYRGWDLFCHAGAEFAVHIVSTWPQNAMKVRTDSKAVKTDQWQHLFFTYDGSGKPAGTKIYVDGIEQPLTTENDTLKDTIRTTVPLKIGQRHTGEHLDNVAMQDVRLYARKLDPKEIMALAKNAEISVLAAVDPAKRTPEQQEQLFGYYLGTRDKGWQAASEKVAALEVEQKKIQEQSPVTHVQQERMDMKPMAAILYRGQYDQTRDKVEPAVFSALNPLPPNAPKNRLGLAQWIVNPENPLTARVMVNRFWQELFGTGIVKTSEDFGIMGDVPSNQDLLDWLAVEFRESGWDVKRLMKMLVMTSTYRQESMVTPEKFNRDPANRYLSRGSRYRMDGEMLRDLALSVSGLLVPKVGGPSVRPYQPPGVWEAVAMQESDTRFYKQDHGEALYRRSMYTFWKRAAPPASMELFNATAREVSCLRRERTNTPLQALVTMNDIQFIEASRVLAERVIKEASADPAAKSNTMAQKVLGRDFRPEEMNVVLATQKDLLDHYKANPEEAKKLIAVGESMADSNLDAAALAAWTMVANQILNLDEAMNK